MSTKLNAEELAAKRYKDEHEPDAVINVSPYQWVRLGYSCAIGEVAQPIADQRDELLEALEECKRLVYGVRALGKYPEGLDHAIMIAAQAIAKCATP